MMDEMDVTEQVELRLVIIISFFPLGRWSESQLSFHCKYFVHTFTVYLAIIECQAESDVKNYADQGGCYPPNLEAEVDSVLRNLRNSSHHTKAHWPFNSAIPPRDNYITPCCDWPIFLGRQNMKMELCNN